MPGDESRSRRVAVPVPLLAALGVALFACLVLITWLLGRESGRRLARDPGPPLSAPASRPEGGPPVPAPEAASPTSPPAATPPPPGPLVPVPVPEPATPAPSPEPVARSAEAEAVARYFTELESLSSAGDFDDPQALAMSIVQEMAGGNTGGLDRLLRVQAEIESAVRRMSVPEPCREHHRRSLELSAAAGRLLQTLSRSARSGDLTGVMSATAEAERLQAGAEELRALENSLRSRYGLPPAPS